MSRDALLSERPVLGRSCGNSRPSVGSDVSLEGLSRGGHSWVCIPDYWRCACFNFTCSQDADIRVSSQRISGALRARTRFPGSNSKKASGWLRGERTVRAFVRYVSVGKLVGVSGAVSQNNPRYCPMERLRSRTAYLSNHRVDPHPKPLVHSSRTMDYVRCPCLCSATGCRPYCPPILRHPGITEYT